MATFRREEAPRENEMDGDGDIRFEGLSSHLRVGEGDSRGQRTSVSWTRCRRG